MASWGVAVDVDVAGADPVGVGVAAGAVAPLVEVGVLVGDGLADRVGVADRERLGVRDGVGDHDRVGVDAGVMTGQVGVRACLAGVSVVLSFAGRTST